MAEDRFEPREINFRQWLPWTQIFRGFWVALDPKKLLLAAAGILIMSFLWWLWSVICFGARTKPDWGSADFQSANYRLETDAAESKEPEQRAWKAFKEKRFSWNLFYKAAGPDPVATDAGDLADTVDEYQRVQSEIAKGNTEFTINGKHFVVTQKAYGLLRTWPWYEDRGPNPYLLVSGSAGNPSAFGPARFFPWTRGEFFDWFLGSQVPVLLEPLVKFLRPIYYFLHHGAGFWDRLYFLLIILSTVATWAVFGGAITRIAAVEIARNEKIGLGEALKFTMARWKSYLFASVAPLAVLAGIILFLMLVATIVNHIPILADILDGILWFLVIAAGLVMAVLLVGLVGWPMIHATLSAEGSDSFDAISRSYSYVLQRPWSYFWYVAVSLVYGAAVVFFVVLMGSLMVYLGRWGFSPFVKAQYADRSYLFMYAPTSWQWRELLLQGSEVVGNSSVVSQEQIDRYTTQLHGWNYIGATLVAFWLYLAFLMVVGFGYSFFWSACTIIYLLMRRKVDDTELDEVYLEEEDLDEPYSTPVPPPPPTSAAGAPAGGPVQMVEAPALRSPAAASASAAAPPAPAAEPAAPKPGDGSAAPPGGAATPAV